MTPLTDRLSRQFGRFAENPAGESEATLRRAFWRLAGRYTPYVAVDRDGLRMIVSTSDQSLSRRLFVYHREPELDIREAFAELRSVPGAAERLRGRGIVEIGANIGTSTIEMLNAFDVPNVVAIEPSPENCTVLKLNLVANGMTDRVRLLQLALSDRSGEVELELSADNPGDHRVRMSDARPGDAEASRTTIAVRATTFDRLCEEGEIDLEATGAVWMDAQGHEGHILSGAGRLLSSDVPFLTEYWPYGLRRAEGFDRFHALVREHYEHVLVVGAAADGAPSEIIRTDDLVAYGDRRGWNAESEGADLLFSRHLSALARPVG